MSSSLSKQSLDRLSSCHSDIIVLTTEVSKDFPLIVLAGHRDKAAQDAAVLAGSSKTPWPTSKHNQMPAHAIDLAPYPYNAKDETRLTYFSGYVMGVAAQLKIPLRWGGDWNQDQLLTAEKFQDLFHFELIDT